MTAKSSYSKFENEVLPGYRDRLSKAESTEDAKKFFVETVRELLHKAFKGTLAFEYEDVKLQPESTPPFEVDQRLLEQETFGNAWSDSDLPNILGRLAESAAHRYKHLSRNPEKTEAKIKMH